ncbi:MAG: NAD-dependent succinate-semialdehyde dehydrogenase [Acidobacteriota bacterium]
MPITTTNPATGETLREFESLSEESLAHKLELSAAVFRKYRRTTIASRAEMMTRAAELLENEKAQLGRLMTLEMGKPIRAAIEEAAKCASACRYYALNAESLLAAEPVTTNATESYVSYQPLGPILAIMPWNFPFWQVFRFAAPSLMAGNTCLLKHASNVPQCALAIEDIFRRAGFPNGAFLTLLIGSDLVQRVIDDPRIRAVTLTGSETAGSQVGAQAGKQIKKVVLELGGSDPFIVLSSANLRNAVQTAVRARVINNGQSCIAAKRFIVIDQVADEFESRFVEGMAALKVGDPMDESTDVGPLATADILETLDRQVNESVRAGARLLTGGKRLPGAGNFYAPTVLTDVPKHSPAYHEELFGPCAALFRVHNVDEAIALANDTSFGLGASAWTKDRNEEQQLIDEIEAGLVFINGMVASDARLPFGGVKRSGHGRELGTFGIREFVNIKTVWINREQGGGSIADLSEAE